jgi:hypothetical protein
MVERKVVFVQKPRLRKILANRSRGFAERFQTANVLEPERAEFEKQPAITSRSNSLTGAPAASQLGPGGPRQSRVSKSRAFVILIDLAHFDTLIFAH